MLQKIPTGGKALLRIGLHDQTLIKKYPSSTR